ncbi:MULTISPECIES: acyltransferase [unclassified Caballeronia]|uniref:acyltransferase family protein n=1 Tax=unclassified Caballeronia TaxID=2646786 RepID=UPI0028594A54|nr:MULTISPECIES: acyltransferase [unclassified Caballeronia]MDR5752650.1 acyltransferase [Caballeronia sp. LZ024]MDR5841292.1 acyltransferase [Caballeronia sp. LZ031]
MSHIDAIRAVAVLFVMWMHYSEVFSRIAGSGEWLHKLPYYANFGRIGVVVFFALSGLLIPKSLYGPLAAGTRRFVIRRFFRLYPAFWVSIPLGYLSYRLLFDKPTEAAMWLANATMLPDALGHPEMMGHYWTLETELVFYVLCLVLFWQGGLQRMRDLCVVCVSLGAAFVITSALKMIPATALGQYKGMLYHLSIMFWGACFRQVYDNPDARVVFSLPGVRGFKLDWSYRKAFIAVTGVVASISVLTFAVAIIQHDPEHVINSVSYLIGLAVFALLATVWKIHLRFFAWMGEISYSLYLLHGVPVYVLYWACQRWGWDGGPLGLYMAISAVFAVGLSWLSFRLVEAPCIRLGHALTSSRRTATAAPTGVYIGEPAPDKNGRR